MSDLSGIMGLAKYEGRLLRRTWKFWILAVLVSIVLSVLKIYQGAIVDFLSSFSGSMGGFYSPGNIFCGSLRNKRSQGLPRRSMTLVSSGA